MTDSRYSGSDNTLDIPMVSIPTLVDIKRDREQTVHTWLFPAASFCDIPIRVPHPRSLSTNLTLSNGPNKGLSKESEWHVYVILIVCYNFIPAFTETLVRGNVQFRSDLVHHARLPAVKLPFGQETKARDCARIS